MDIEELMNSAKKIVSKGAKASKNAFEKAGDKVQDFTDKSVVKLEKHQLETKRDCKYEELGLKISELLIQGAAISNITEKDTKIIEDIQKEIKELTDQIVEKENQM